jgi:hypothetical protein
MIRNGLLGLAAAAFIFAGCKKPVYTYKAELAYQVGGAQYDFTVSARDEMMYISAKRDGVELTGISGNQLQGGVGQVAVGDLNGDGRPELYIFSAKESSVPGLLAFTCGAKECSSIGIEGGGGGQVPMDYCGGDSYKIEGKKLIRYYNGCKQANGEQLFIKYALKETSFGLMLVKDSIGKTVTTHGF